ncbi:BadF/BadG/BcrA/BcrD ATPase family protein [Kutzneria buriramensis]|uniref:N-acetylglucosamine kinase-like BadF-type ATPase n=1 Tax=Kutzneria buriramensis TaxID=1045776 RepID=A0A3E0GZA3_9PSEU|nr:BadF/BadG/BcrA/BcrD ATPase family protein [Kutzneria buriramensis]REH32638.1 N-acetylglucosamine kinase-like BadF-type ATPase [Kutzneria buriramensis]
MRVVVGVDVGGTKVAVRIATLDGEVVSDHQWPADGWSATPAAKAARWLRSLLSLAVPADHEIVAVGVGAQGCDTQEHCEALAAAVAALGVHATVVNDAALLVPAAGLDAGIGVIAGTGSIAVGTDAAGEVLFAGGWGWVLGDEASAPAILREATKAALAAYDDRRPDDGLMRALLQHYAVPDPPALARAVNDTPTPENWGPAAVAVFEAADAGSTLAARVIDEAARGLKLLVSQLIARGAIGDTVVAAGSVIVHQPRLADRFRSKLADFYPSLKLRLLEVPPVAGGVILALRRLSPQR